MGRERPAACSVLAAMPRVGQRVAELGGWGSGQVHDQLREMDLRVDAMASAGAHQAREDRRRLAALQAAHVERVLAVERVMCHRAFTRAVVDGHFGVVQEGGERAPLVERVAHRAHHRLLVTGVR